MRYFILTLSLLFGITAMAQPAFNPVEQGNRQAGVHLMVSYADMYLTETTLSKSENYNYSGLHVAGMYGWFIENGWLIGLQSNIGFLNHSLDKQGQWGFSNNYFDMSISPVTRYYFNVGKYHRFKPFLLAGLPIVYSSVKEAYNHNSLPDQSESSISMRAAFGVGAAYFGSAGSIEINLGNSGFYLGINKFFKSSKK